MSGKSTFSEKTSFDVKSLAFTEKSSKIGHRKRVKEKFKKQDIANLSNIEIFEALLFFCNPRRDVKTEASILHKITKGSIINFLLLEQADLKKANIKYVNENLLFLNQIIKEVVARYFKDKISEYVFANTYQIAEYLMARSGFLSREQLRVLYLNSKNKLIEDSIFSRGTVNETAIYIREVVSIALQKAAISVIISHNHPSGDVMPSREDIAITHDLKRALDIISITLQDHIIVSKNCYFSFKVEGLL